MIRKLKEIDRSQVADIWLDTNITGHSFIAPQYWKDNFEAVKEMLLQAEVYVYEAERENKIQGFVGLSDEYIAGIFVKKDEQSGGIGKELLDFVKSLKNQLNLRVYQKNIRAVKFYQRENFEIQGEGMDENTGEKEYAMVWKHTFQS